MEIVSLPPICQSLVVFTWCAQAKRRGGVHVHATPQQYVYMSEVNGQPSCDQSKKFTIQWPERFPLPIDLMVARLFSFGSQVLARGVGR